MSDEPFVLPGQLAASLVLVRHGESTYVAEGRFQGRHDPPLSPLGERQAALVAARLASRNEGSPLPIPARAARAIWHSPLRRAAETAAAIGEQQRGTPAVRPEVGLTELAQGEWEGLLHSEVSTRWPTELAAWRRDPLHEHAPGGEALLDAAERVRRALRSLLDDLSAAQGQGQRSYTERSVTEPPSPPGVAVPGYPAAPANEAATEPWVVLVAHDGIFRLALMTLLGLDYERFWSFPFSLCAITVVSLRDGVPALRAHNLSGHLAPLAAEQAAAEEARGDRRGAL